MRRFSLERFFVTVATRPILVALLVLVPLLALSAYVPKLTKDTRAEAFLPVGHPAVEYRKTVKEIFGLEDPMVVAVVNRGPQGVFNPQTLNLVRRLSAQVAGIDGVDPDRVTSLSTEKNLASAPEGLLVSRFLEGDVEQQADANAVRAAVMDIPFYVGSLVSENGEATLIAAELLDQDDAEQVYFRLQALVDGLDHREDDEIYVAGEGALVGYLGTYIDRDTHRLTPIASVVVLVLLYLSYRTLLGVIVPTVTALCSLGAVFGVMALLGKPVYFITSGVPVILIAIAVADSVHILGRFYELRSGDSSLPIRKVVVEVMTDMSRPIIITSLTTVAGFLAVHISSDSPPMQDFGLMAALGIVVALAVSVTVVPALLVLMPGRAPVRGGQAGADPTTAGQPASRMAAFGRLVAGRPAWIIGLTLLIVGVGGIGVLRLEVNDSDIDNFQSDEPVRIAHEVINDLFQGAHNLSVVVEAATPEGLLEPSVLRRIDELQSFLEDQPHVNGTRSIVDYLKQINRALNDGRREAFSLPDSSEAVAQYLLLYSMGGDPTDLADEIEYDYRRAHVRVFLDSGDFVDEREVVEAAERAIDRLFDGEGVSAKLSGRVAVHYAWMKQLWAGHVGSVVLALFAVWVLTALTFRSLVAGTFALAPVAISVFLIYAVMGHSGIWLGIGTSMSAAIAIGLGVDFSIHVLDRLIVLVRKERRELEDALTTLYQSTGRALLFNFLIVFCGFGILVVSESPGLLRFGALVAVAVAASFVASMTLIPALAGLIRPAFLFGGPAGSAAGLPASQSATGA